MDSNDIIWLTIGLVGQALFMMRFIVQWIHSERHQKSMIPVSFWYFSLSGGVIVLAYGIHRVDPVIIIGQLPGTFVYARNLMLIRREHRDALAEMTEQDLGT
ncbi:lipid-A-disaccharide synthase [Methylomonas methanica]|uniref:Lipid-A-disaccharide synthase n=2 Tax=Methylomonas TaxID=416 RepID=A0A177MMB6_METMH|nr:lipid-A-disaccharide synthase [Methylomonas methanica]OAI06936.1 lipid-A-disaccharide synthase [Methylomonas methanica]